VVTWFRSHVEVGRWGRIFIIVAALIEGVNAVFNFRDGKTGWGIWWGLVAAFALFAAVFAGSTNKES
jgi:hypothetical protein